MNGSRVFGPRVATSVCAAVLLAAFAVLLLGCPPEPANHDPVAAGDAFTVNRDSLDNPLDVLSNDTTAPDTGETLGITAVGTPDQGGSVSIDGGGLRYTPAAGFTGTDTFTYTIGDGNGGTATATVTVTVEDWAADSTTFEATWSDETVLIDEPDLGLLRASDLDNHVFTFDAAGLATRGLDIAVGDVLVVHGLDVRRVTSLTEDNGALVVETGFASLNEAITDGTLAWDQGIEFTPDDVKSVRFAGHTYPVPKDGTPIDITLPIGEFTYRIQATLDGPTSDFTFTVKKDLGGGLGAEFKAHGVIQRFRTQNAYVFSGGELESADQGTSGLRGEGTLELVVAGSMDNYELLNLPATVFSVPFMVGPVPVTLDIKIRVIVNLIVPIDGSARVTASFGYDSDLGLEYRGTQVSVSGGLGGHDIEEGVHETGASSHISAIFGIGFPRVEISVPGGLATGWAQIAYQVGGTYSVYPACQTADAVLLGSVGYELSAFGLFGVSGTRTIFQESRELLRAGDCGKDLLPLDPWSLAEPQYPAPMP